MQTNDDKYIYLFIHDIKEVDSSIAINKFKNECKNLFYLLSIIYVNNSFLDNEKDFDKLIEIFKENDMNEVEEHLNSHDYNVYYDLCDKFYGLNPVLKKNK